jgi:hypothetical protein
MSRKEQRLYRIEERDDQTFIGMLVLCTGIGFFLGALTGGTWAAVGYGLLGLLMQCRLALSST